MLCCIHNKDPLIEHTQAVNGKYDAKSPAESWFCEGGGSWVQFLETAVAVVLSTVHGQGYLPSFGACAQVLGAVVTSPDWFYSTNLGHYSWLQSSQASPDISSKSCQYIPSLSSVPESESWHGLVSLASVLWASLYPSKTFSFFF